MNHPSQLRPRQHTRGHRRDPLWIAFIVHRLSGLALACFLPLHFLALGLAIDGEARLDGFLKWTANPAVKLAWRQRLGWRPRSRR